MYLVPLKRISSNKIFKISGAQEAQLKWFKRSNKGATTTYKNAYETFMWPLLRIFQVLGMYPISLSKFEASKLSSYDSKIFFYSILLLFFRIWNIYWFTIYTVQSVTFGLIPSPSEETFYYFSNHLNSVFQIFQILNTFTSIKALHGFHNKWREFSISFNQCFFKPFNFSCWKFRNLTFCFTFTPFIVGTFRYILFFNPEKTGFFNWLLLHFLNAIHVLHLIFVLGGEDCKIVINSRCIKEGFRLLNKEIRFALKIHKENPESSFITGKNIRQWKGMILMLKKLSVLTGSISMLPQLITIAHEIFLVTGLLYFNVAGLINGTKSINNFGTILPCLMIIWHSLRQYVKFIVAHSVKEEELSIVNDLRMFDRRSLDWETKEEFYDFTNTVIVDSARINFAKYFTLSKESFFSIVGRMITYLIVLIQFQAATP